MIDGIRLCKARRLRYANNDMAELEAQLQAAQDCRFRLIATDGVFSMDGIAANLPAICDLAERTTPWSWWTTHAVGFMGERGSGTPEHCGVEGRVDIVTGTLGKALGGASGGYHRGAQGRDRRGLRQRSRPYLFSNTLAPVIAATSIKVLDLLEGSGELRRRLKPPTPPISAAADEELGFTLVPGEHPIIPVMLGEAKLAQDMAAALAGRKAST